MTKLIYAFVAGVGLFQFSPVIPQKALLLTGLIPIALMLRWRPLLLLAACLLGLVWGGTHAWLQVPKRLAAELEAVPLELTGVVASLPEGRGDRVRFLIDCISIVQAAELKSCPGQLKLSWYSADSIPEPGQVWRLMVKLKHPRSSQNPGTFDYEGWLYQQGIHAVGYVVADPGNQRVGERYLGYLFQRLRFILSRDIQQVLSERRAQALVSALLLGDRRMLGDQQWEVLRSTGTNHLFAISGLHVGIIAGLFYWLGKSVWRLLSLVCLYLPAQKAGVLFAVFAAFLYAGLAGFSLPTLRALIMLGVFALARLLDRQSGPWDCLSRALLLIVLLDPLALLSGGFVLSFSAVLVIVLGLQNREQSRSQNWYRLPRLQWSIFVGLSPLLLLLGFGVSIVAPLVNLLMVPLFSLLVVPALMLGVTGYLMLPQVGDWIFSTSVQPLLLSMDLLYWLASVDWVYLLEPRVTTASAIALSAMMLLYLLPGRLPGRMLYGLFLLPLFLDSPQRPPVGDFKLTQLDVGQGLAMVVATRHHLLLYDAGPRFGSGFDAGRSILLPYLRAMGYSRVDRWILSNGDMDHRGGFPYVYGHFSVGSVFSGEPERIVAASVNPCYAGQSWTWDEVRFEILHPEPDGRWQGNNASCVLRVSNRSGSLLITGDIEAEAERSLLVRQPKALAADVVTVPHHGSSSSSSHGFVAAVSPDYALVSAGYRNRWHFPKPDVVDRWRSVGAVLYQSSTDGAVNLHFSAQHGVQQPQSYRQQQRRYWMY